MVTRIRWSLLALLCACASAPPSAPPASAPEPVAPASPPAVVAESEPQIQDLPCDPPEGHLGASLVLPPGGAAPPWVAILDVGAQPWDRWGVTPQRALHHYRELALALARGGGAVVAYDKRGTGASPGALNDAEGRVRDATAMAACVRATLPGVPIVRIGHSAGSVVAARAEGDRAATVLLSTPLPAARWPSGPVLALRGTADPAGGDPAAEPVEGADHLLMRDGALAPEVPARILAWLRGQGL